MTSTDTPALVTKRDTTLPCAVATDVAFASAFTVNDVLPAEAVK